MKRSVADRRKARIRAIKCSPKWKDIYRHDRTLYESMLFRQYGKTTSTALTLPQLDELLTFMNGGRFFRSAGAPQAGRGNGKVQRLASVKECAKIGILTGLVEWEYEDGFERWLKKRFRIRRVKTLVQAFRIIEGLKGMIRNQLKAKFGEWWREYPHDDPKIIDFIKRHGGDAG